MQTISGLRVLVVDDEPLARRRLHDLLVEKPQVERIDTVDRGEEAVQIIRGRQPDLVFLDVQMPGQSGLDVVREVGPDDMPVTVFVTAYDHHALEAFDMAAVDYLLKPFDDERFDRAFARAREAVRLRALGAMKEQFLALLQGAPTEDKEDAPGNDADTAEPPGEGSSGGYLERVAVEAKGRIQVVSVSDIDYITADGGYLKLHTGAKTHLIRERMKTLEERLDPEYFFRIHRSTIVRLDRIDALLRRSGGRYDVRLEDGTRLAVSRSRREALEAWMTG